MNKNPLFSATPAPGARFRNLHAASLGGLLAAIASLLIVPLSLSHAAQSCTLAWDGSSDPNVAGYELRYGTSSGNPSQSIDVLKTTTFTVSNLNDATTYYFVVAAYNAAKVESQPSNEVSYTTPPTPVATPAGATAGSGSITREVWTGISGTTVANISVGAAPNLTDTLPSFEAPTNWADNYGTRMRGYITAPVTGNYTFWIAGDDNSELWLSSINDNPANKVRIAWVSGSTASRQWDKFSTQKSAAIPLRQGQRYYVEALQKEFLDKDNLAVGWAKPGESTSAPSEVIPGSVLSRFSGTQSHSLGDPLARNLSITSPQLVGQLKRTATSEWKRFDPVCRKRQAGCSLRLKTGERATVNYAPHAEQRVAIRIAISQGQDGSCSQDSAAH